MQATHSHRESRLWSIWEWRRHWLTWLTRCWLTRSFEWHTFVSLRDYLSHRSLASIVALESVRDCVTELTSDKSSCQFANRFDQCFFSSFQICNRRRSGSPTKTWHHSRNCCSMCPETRWSSVLGKSKTNSTINFTLTAIMMIIWSFYESHRKPRKCVRCDFGQFSHRLSSSMRTRAAYRRWLEAIRDDADWRSHVQKRICVESNETYPQQLISANDGAVYITNRNEKEGQLEIIKFNIIILFVLSLRLHRLCVCAVSSSATDYYYYYYFKTTMQYRARCRIPTMRRWGDEAHIWESRFRIPTVISIVIHLTAPSNGYRVRIAFAYAMPNAVSNVQYARTCECTFSHFSESRTEWRCARVHFLHDVRSIFSKLIIIMIKSKSIQTVSEHFLRDAIFRAILWPIHKSSWSMTMHSATRQHQQQHLAYIRAQCKHSAIKIGHFKWCGCP